MSGYISYPSVDNTVYPKILDIEGIVKGLASGTPALAPVCKKVLVGPLTPTRGKVETTDHPPIHPTGQGDPTTLDGGQLKLYNLIARRFLATLLGPATIENTKLSIDVAGEPVAARAAARAGPPCAPARPLPSSPARSASPSSPRSRSSPRASPRPT